MTRVELLHNAARQYCIGRKAEWSQRYAQLTAEERIGAAAPGGGWTYTDEAHDTFPRVSVLSAILNEVERFVPTDFRSEEESRALLILAGETAGSVDRTATAIKASAVQEERGRFIEFVQTTDAQELAIVPVLPFRRVLGTDEHRQLHGVFGSKSARRYGGAARLPEAP